jgi:2-methylcitrate dehydratase PrpD
MPHSKGGSELAVPGLALINRTAAHLQDYGDVLDFVFAHVSAVLLPLLLVLREGVGAGGRPCVDGYLVGFGIMAHLARAMNPRHYQSGCRTTLTPFYSLPRVDTATRHLRALGG